MKKTLFCIRQPGAIDFIHPLLKKWQKKSVSSFKIITSRENKQYLLKYNLQHIDIIPFEYCNSKILLHLFKKWKPDQIVLSSSTRTKNKIEREEIECLKYARSQNIKTIQYIDSLYDYYLRIKHTNGPKFYPNKILLINEYSKKQAIDEGVPSNLIKIVGHPAWEKINTINPVNNDDAVFINQPIKKDYGSRLGYDEQEIFDKIYKIYKKKKYIKKLYWCPHPRDRIVLDKKKYPDVIIEHNTKLAIEKSRIVIGMFSSSLIKACLMGKKVISFQSSNKNNKNIISLEKLDLLNIVNNSKELIRIIINNDKNNNYIKFKNTLKKSLKKIENELR